jgi:hypothetical protein
MTVVGCQDRTMHEEVDMTLLRPNGHAGTVAPTGEFAPAVASYRPWTVTEVVCALLAAPGGMATTTIDGDRRPPETPT